MKKLVAQIKEEIDAFVVNADAQTEKGNKAAGARARAGSAGCDRRARRDPRFACRLVR